MIRGTGCKGRAEVTVQTPLQMGNLFHILTILLKMRNLKHALCLMHLCTLRKATCNTGPQREGKVRHQEKSGGGVEWEEGREKKKAPLCKKKLVVVVILAVDRMAPKGHFQWSFLLLAVHLDSDKRHGGPTQRQPCDN